MSRTAPVDHPIATVIAERWSPRSFTDECVTVQEVHSLFEAARWAPSSSNSQPWRFVYALRDLAPEAHARIADVLNDKNRMWAQHAPLLVLSVAQLREGARERPYAQHDVGLAVGMLLVQATELGLRAHQMAGFDKDLARATLAIPDDFAPVAVIAIGHAGPADALPEDLATRETAERTRRPLSEFAFPGGFGARG